MSNSTLGQLNSSAKLLHKSCHRPRFRLRSSKIGDPFDQCHRGSVARPAFELLRPALRIMLSGNFDIEDGRDRNSRQGGSDRNRPARKFACEVLHATSPANAVPGRLKEEGREATISIRQRGCRRYDRPQRAVNYAPCLAFFEHSCMAVCWIVAARTIDNSDL